MSKNYIGTIFRIIAIFFCLFSFWSILLGLFYFIISMLFNIPFNFIGYISIFIGFVISRMIYLKTNFL
jgi:hypothetical protein